MTVENMVRIFAGEFVPERFYRCLSSGFNCAQVRIQGSPYRLTHAIAMAKKLPTGAVLG